MESKFGRSSSGARPGTRLRGALSQAYEARGKDQGILWLHYSPKAKKDVALATALQYGHFLLVESDPSIEVVDYNPASTVTQAVGDAFVDIVQAQVEFKTGVVEWRQLTDSTPAPYDVVRQNLIQLIANHPSTTRTVQHRVVTANEVFQCPQRIRNWHRIVPWLVRAREWALHDYANLVSGLIHRRGRIEFRESLALGDTYTGPLFGTALLQGVQRGIYLSDLDYRPFTERSNFYVREL